MRQNLISAALILAVSSVTAQAATISVTAVPAFPVTAESPNNDNDMLSFAAASASVPLGGTFSQPGTFFDGFVFTQPAPDPFTFQDTFTVNGITQILTFTGSDFVTNAADTLTIDALGTVAFGSTVLTFEQVVDFNGQVDGPDSISLDATVSAPEPSSVALLGSSIVSLAGAARRCRKR